MGGGVFGDIVIPSKVDNAAYEILVTVGLTWKSDGQSTDAPVNVSEGSSVYVSTMTLRSSRS